MLETAKANGLSPYCYLEYILGGLPGVPFRQYPEILDDYLPRKRGDVHFASIV
ncbi:hypothetical protein KL86SPO_50625 [uncultured Sporomusa sp.]|uniref:Transposase IS66 C-terminal domain-containing protein n=1 Tax=uncultured Sporomusa sp. TaxID=307249 RepID=A0A212LZ98_9FIRM|nr:hypothetical protein KL86SPO_50625 [uncultured Sporomusa sp.]